MPPRSSPRGKIKVKKLIDFDEYFTSALNGFKDANDYYTQASSKPFLKLITRPTLLINAQDDPFYLKVASLPVGNTENLILI